MTSMTPAALTWQCCPFAQLTLQALQQIYAARQAVFVLEQQCFYQDVDGWDDQAWHLTAWLPESRLPMAYARLFPPGVRYAEASMGRVLTTMAGRGQGLGRELVRRAVAQSELLFVGAALRISAQAHLQDFYQAFGFEAQGAPYLEDDIPHVEMLRPALVVNVKP